jgi:hypothetical protein
MQTKDFEMVVKKIEDFTKGEPWFAVIHLKSGLKIEGALWMEKYNIVRLDIIGAESESVDPLPMWIDIDAIEVVGLAKIV